MIKSWIHAEVLLGFREQIQETFLTLSCALPFYTPLHTWHRDSAGSCSAPGF